MVAAKESVVQNNADAIKKFRYKLLTPRGLFFLEDIYSVFPFWFCRDAITERDQEMKRILIEEETQLKNLAAEYKQRFDRERVRLLKALRECGRCTKLISEILPACMENQRLAGELLSGKPSADGNSNIMMKPQPTDVYLYPGEQSQIQLGDEGFWDLTSICPK
jgi:hypothetical protein